MATRYTSVEQVLLDEARALDERDVPFARALERCTLPAFIHDGERISHVNMMLLGWLGYAEPELVGGGVGILAEEADRAGLLAAVGARLGEPPEEAHVQRFRGKLGEVRIGQVLARGVLRRDESGLVVMIQPWSASLRSAELRGLLEAAVDQLHDIVFITEAEPIDSVGRRIVFVNQAYSRVAGFDPREVIGRTPNVTVGEATQRDVLKRIEAGLRAGKPVHEQLIKYAKEGSTYWVDLTIVPVFDEQGKHTHWLSVQRDITENKRLIEKLVETERLASAGMLAAGLAHEINNPLTSVRSSLEWLAEQIPILVGESRQSPGEQAIPPASEKEVMSAIADALSGAHRVESALRHLSELTGTSEDVRQPIDVCDSLDSALEMLEGQFRVPGEIVLEYEHVPFVLGSEVRLTQVFFNLLLNAAQALDHAKSERNRVIVRVRSVPPTRVRIDIEDTGAGVPVEIARKLFSPFVSSRPRGLGKGLGLFVAREIVRALSGELSYRSEPGQGTTFNVVLPSGGARGSATRLDGRLSSAIAAARILVVNSDRGVAAALRRILSPAELVLVRSPALALELLQERFDVVFAELLGATSDGLELIDHAAAVDARLGSRLVLTSHLEFSGDQREKAAATGIAVLDKPFDRAALRAAVAAALGVPVDG